MTDLEMQKPIPGPEVDAFVNDNLGKYVAAMEAAITVTDTPDIVIGFPIQRGITEDERAGRQLIFEIMEEKFLPSFPDRRMWKHVQTKFKGQHYKDVEPPAHGFEVIHLNIPSDKPPKKGNGKGVGVGLVN